MLMRGAGLEDHLRTPVSNVIKLLARALMWKLTRTLKPCRFGFSAGMLQALLEEFGKWIKPGTGANLAERDTFYQAAYQEVLNVSVLLCPPQYHSLAVHIPLHGMHQP